MFIAGEHRDAISRVDDLIATVNFNSICYVVQARILHAATRRTWQLTFLGGIYVSFPRKHSDEEQRL